MDFLDYTYLAHHGILGMKWGIRRYQNADGTLTEEGRQRLAAKQWKQDTKWAKKNESKIKKYATKATKPYLKEAERRLKQEYAGKYKSGTNSKNYINAYNKQMAAIMNVAVADLETPNGNAIRFVAKRGSVGVYTALTAKDYDLNQLRNGVYSSGRVAYKKTTVGRT